MDSVSQATLGAVVALVVTRGSQPRKAIISGALLGTLPDLDVLIPQPDALTAMINHRSWTHSWLVQLAVSPIIGWLLYLRDKSWSLGLWISLTALVLTTHSSLDALTIYGTWLFWPLGFQPVMGGSVFIIDPLFTLPLVIACIGYWRRASLINPPGVQKAIVALALSCIYLGWGMWAKTDIESRAREILAEQKIPINQLVATPTPFNSILWRVLAVDEDQFHEGFFSFLDGSQSIRFNSYPRNLELLDELDDTALVQQFARFNHGYYALSQINNDLVVTDLRMGSEPFFMFRFEIARLSQSTDDSVVSKALSVTPKAKAVDFKPGIFFPWIWQRISNPSLPTLTQYSG